MPVRGGGSASAVTITSWSALATMGRSYGSSSSAVRRSTVRALLDSHDPGQRALVAGGVADDADPVADDTASGPARGP